MWALPDVSQGENHQGIDSSFLCPKVEGPFLVNTQRVGKEVSGKGERPGCLYVYGSLCLEVFVVKRGLVILTFKLYLMVF